MEKLKKQWVLLFMVFVSVGNILIVLGGWSEMLTPAGVGAILVAVGTTAGNWGAE